VVYAYSTTVASLDDQTKVGRESSLVRSTSSLLVGVRGRHVIRELPRALKHFTLITGAIGVFDLLGHRLYLIRGVGNTNQITPRDTVERVACSADLLVDQVTSSDTVTRRFMRVRNISEFDQVALPGMIIRVQPALVWPWICGWVETNLSGGGRVYFTDKWKGSVQVGVPGKRASSKERRRNEGCSGIDQRLGCQSGIWHEGSWVLQTWNALGDAALEDANLACCHEREQPNSEIW